MCKKIVVLTRKTGKISNETVVKNGRKIVAKIYSKFDFFSVEMNKCQSSHASYFQACMYIGKMFDVFDNLAVVWEDAK